MAVLYLTEQGSRLHREGERLIVSKEGQVLAEIPAGTVEQVCIFGNIALTTPVITYFLRRGIDCVFLSQHGQYFGRLISSESRFGLLRQRQYQAISEAETSLRLARALALGKLANQMTLLRRWGGERGDLVLLDELAERVRLVADLAGLRGLEGQAAAVYFGSLRQILRPDLGFRGRQKRPPRDPVNSLLSLGYTLLGYIAWSAVQAVGLDPYGGFLHATVYSRPSLALDLIEEFRPLVDDFVLRLVVERRYGPDDFTQSAESGAVLLTDAARQRFLADWSRLVAAPCAVDAQPRPLRRLLDGQARQVARIVLGQQRDYRPVRLWAGESDAPGGAE